MLKIRDFMGDSELWYLYQETTTTPTGFNAGSHNVMGLFLAHNAHQKIRKVSPKGELYSWSFHDQLALKG